MRSDEYWYREPPGEDDAAQPGTGPAGARHTGTAQPGTRWHTGTRQRLRDMARGIAADLTATATWPGSAGWLLIIAGCAFLGTGCPLWAPALVSGTCMAMAVIYGGTGTALLAWHQVIMWRRQGRPGVNERGRE